MNAESPFQPLPVSLRFRIVYEIGLGQENLYDSSGRVCLEGDQKANDATILLAAAAALVIGIVFVPSTYHE
jgi:hypothetical protein